MKAVRVVVQGRVKTVKTEYSEEETGAPMKGTLPYWPDSIMKRYIKPAAKAAGMDKNIGWPPSVIPSARC